MRNQLQQAQLNKIKSEIRLKKITNKIKDVAFVVGMVLWTYLQLSGNLASTFALIAISIIGVVSILHLSSRSAVMHNELRYYHLLKLPSYAPVRSLQSGIRKDMAEEIEKPLKAEIRLNGRLMSIVGAVTTASAISTIYDIFKHGYRFYQSNVIIENVIYYGFVACICLLYWTLAKSEKRLCFIQDTFVKYIMIIKKEFKITD